PAATTSLPSSSSSSPSSPGGSAAGVYAAAGAGMLSETAKTAEPLVYVPNTKSDTVDVIDPTSMTVVSSFPVGHEPQHVVPSWDEKTLWVNDDLSNDLYPIDPTTGKPGAKVAVDDPYNLYFTPDGSSAMVMAERLRRIDFRDPHTMALQHSLPVPCGGVNHADFSADGSFFLASCEFSGKLLVIPTDGSAVRSVIDLNAVATPGANDPMAARTDGVGSEMEKGVTSMPQDVRLAPDGKTFLAADMQRNGVWLIDAATQKVRGFVHTGKGAHGIYPSRDASVLYVSNRDEGSVSVLDAATLAVTTTWPIPGGGSPDMGGVSADGTQLWLSGRYDGVVYVISTADGSLLKKIRVGDGPHGLAVWPQPGQHSLGHTGNMR
ncbi:MAG: YncE family protein, partial [Quadrisphaera sp.]